MTLTPLLKVPEVAVILAASDRFVLDELRRKNLVGVKKKGLGWRIDRDDLARYIEAHKNVRAVKSA